jgi:hypothetical protein
MVPKIKRPRGISAGTLGFEPSHGRDPLKLCRLMCTKKKSHRTHPIHTSRAFSLIARTVRLVLGRISCLAPDQTGGREAVALVFTLSRGDFEELWPLFCWAEEPRYYPRPVIRSLLLPEFRRGRGDRCRLLIAQRLFGRDFPTSTPSLVHEC